MIPNSLSSNSLVDNTYSLNRKSATMTNMNSSMTLNSVVLAATTTTAASSVTSTSSSQQTADIQAQFELSIELRRFINIDLFQRGYYQIRVAARLGNKQVPSKIQIQLEPNKNNNDLSDSMYPSCVYEEYGVSKTFLILYRNEEIILDDHFIFKISTLVNALNLTESFEKLDIQLSVELWFTENDYKPLAVTLLNIVNSIAQANNGYNNQQRLSSTASSTSLNNQLNYSPSNQTATQQQQANTTTNNNNNNNTNGMQILCSRIFKIHFDSRKGIHIQVPVLFDYFHLSAVLVTIHSSLLTLLPPVMFGPTQKNQTLASILFGKDLSQFKSTAEIGANLLKRAVHIHDQICQLLLTAYEHLQDQIFKISRYLAESERKKIKLEHINCQEKLHKLNQIIQNCSDPETLDDLANRHIAQCSAENIMIWCLFLEHFSMNEAISPYLATEYHNKRLKRFSESFFTKDLPRKSLQEYEMSDNYSSLNDYIRQSQYFIQLPELSISCDDLDGTADNQPVIFEENYVENASATNNITHFSSSPSSSIFHLIENSSSSSSISKETAKTQQSVNRTPFSLFRSSNKSLSKTNNDQQQQRKNSVSSSEKSSSSMSCNQSSSQATSVTALASATDLNSSSNHQQINLQKKFRKKISKSIQDSSLFPNPDNPSIKLVSYKKMDDYFSSNSNSSDMPPPPQQPLSSSNNSNGSKSSTASSSSASSSHQRKLQHQLSSPILPESDDDGVEQQRILVEESRSLSGSFSSSKQSMSMESRGPANLLRRSLHLKSAKNKNNYNNNSNQNQQQKHLLHSLKEQKTTTDINCDVNVAAEVTAEIVTKAVHLKIADDDNQSQHEAEVYQSLPNLLSNENKNNSANLNDIAIVLNDDEECPIDSAEQKQPSISNLQLEPNEMTTSKGLLTPDMMIKLNAGNGDDIDQQENSSATGESQSIDCSSKSRALYESFRGKVNTLERPRRARRSLNGILNTAGSTDEALPASAAVPQQQLQLKVDHLLNEKCGSLNSSLISMMINKSSNNNENENEQRQLQLSAVQEVSSTLSSPVSNVVSNASSFLDTTTATATIIALSTAATAPASSNQNIHQQNQQQQKPKLKKQLTINSDRNSLSSLLFNENLFKFVIHKEELKRGMIRKKYQGNIYSEFIQLFCLNAPYFYQELTPKLTSDDNHHLDNSNSSSSNRNNNTSVSAVNRRSSSLLMQSKSKIMNLFHHHYKTEKTAATTGNENDEEGSENENEIIPTNKELADSEYDDEKIHLVVCVHGLDGNSGDLRLVRTYIELALPGAKLDFLMSEHNQENTFDDIEVMTLQLIKEINDYLDAFGINPERISFVGHSLGNLIIRSAVAHEKFRPLHAKLHTYLSLSGPHLGTLYNSSGLINMGMWIMQKWKKSGSLLQLSLKDNADPYKTFLYKLSTRPTFEHFKHILLVASPQDRYVPFHSARIDMCKAAGKDNVYREMLKNILRPIQESKNIKTFKRFSAFHTLPSGTSNFIGRAAHIAVLDSELFVEKLVLVSVAKYFR